MQMIIFPKTLTQHSVCSERTRANIGEVFKTPDVLESALGKLSAILRYSGLFV